MVVKIEKRSISTDHLPLICKKWQSLKLNLLLFKQMVNRSMISWSGWFVLGYSLNVDWMGQIKSGTIWRLLIVYGIVL